MQAARAYPESKRSVRLRLINRDTVLAEQCLLFYSSQTLDGLKLHIYVMMKILKLCVQPQPKLTSYDIKWAVHQALLNMTPKKEEIGACIRRVLNYATLRDRFEEINFISFYLLCHIVKLSLSLNL